jgi:hypothetical protein
VTVERMPERAFRLIVQAILTIMGIRMVWLAAVAAAGL